MVVKFTAVDGDKSHIHGRIQFKLCTLVQMKSSEYTYVTCR